VSLLKVPYAKSPFDLHIRIARDFEVEAKEKDKKIDKGKEDKKEKSKEKNEKEEKEDGSSSGSGSNKASEDAAKALTSKSEGACAKEKHSDGRHKRMWNVVITCDEWKSIYGVKNVSVSKAKRAYEVLVAKCCS
jgi:hypothetical protein